MLLHGLPAMIQLVYISSACPLFSPEDVAAILEVSRSNNGRDSITGLLVYKSGNVIQLLEGPADRVRTLFGKIRVDPRHHRVTKLYEQEITVRDFPDWTMGFREADGAFFSAQPDGYSAILEPNFDWSTLESAKVQALLREFITAIR